MNLIVTREDIKHFEKLKVISQIGPIQARIQQLERKYQTSVGDFEAQLPYQEEDFERWDDLLEWKAYSRALARLKDQLRAIENAQDIRIAED
ncbi:MAG: hypothetical protein ACTSU5_08185 [Promethearchaeota archaeon]